MTALLAAILLKGSILMAAAAAVAALLVRASAATRHFVWSLTTAGLLLLPVCVMTLPEWRVAVPMGPIDTPAALDAAGSVTPTPVAPAASTPDAAVALRERSSARAMSVEPLSWTALLIPAYLLGVVCCVGRVVSRRAAAGRIVRESSEITADDWRTLLIDCAARVGVTRPVTLRRSRVELMPMTMGTVAPAIVVPANADEWDEDRRRAVLLHELAHIARQDCLTQTLSAVACAVYWCHPGAWYVARRLRIERELACDDRVLAAGAHAGDYASHLLELAYSWSGRRAPALVVGMASRGKLEGRMRAVLDPARNRAALTRRMRLAGTAAAAALLVPLAAMTITAAAPEVRSTLMGPSSDREPPAIAQGPRPRAAEQSIASPDTAGGTWELRPGRTGDYVRLQVSAGALSSNSEFHISELDAITAQPLSRADGPIRFRISRQAGSLEVAGTLSGGRGSGTFSFVPSSSFIAGLARRGFPRPTAQQLFALAQTDIGFEIIDELAAQNYARPELEDLVRAAHHGVDTDFVREMGRAGYRVGTLDMLIRFRDHGVDPEYVRAMRALGVSDLPPDVLVRVRDHGVDPEYIADLRSLGYGVMPIDMLIRARDHGVEGDYLRGMRQLGFTLTIDAAIRARDHGVDTEYVEQMAAEGYTRLPIDTLVRLRDHGITPDYVREMRKRGFDKLSAEEIIQRRDRGEPSLGIDFSRLHYRIARLMQQVEQHGRRLEAAFERLTR